MIKKGVSMLSEKQIKFVKALYPFTQLNYGQLNLLWQRTTNSSSKISSSLISKLEQKKILMIKQEEGKKRKSRYLVKQFDIATAYPELFEASKIPEAYRHETRPAYKVKEVLNFHDEALKSLVIQTLPTEYEALAFPRVKNNINGILVPDAILVKNGVITYLEYDNLTERAADFLSKLPRYLYEAKQDLEKKINLVFIFKDETVQLPDFVNTRKTSPIPRMIDLQQKIYRLKTLDQKPYWEALKSCPNFKIYFLTHGEAHDKLEDLLEGKYFQDISCKKPDQTEVEEIQINNPSKSKKPITIEKNKPTSRPDHSSTDKYVFE